MSMDRTNTVADRGISEDRVDQPAPGFITICEGEELGASDTMSMRRVLLVEDDDVLRANYQALLNAHRLSVYACATKVEAMAAFAAETFDVVILDVSLGHDYEAGFDLCQAFREKQKITPIIFLTERDEDADRISGLRLGADDYLSKTISGSYLVARINALVRRIEAITQIETSESKPTSQLGNQSLRIDERLSRAFWKDRPLDLSLTQFWILKLDFGHSCGVAEGIGPGRGQTEAGFCSGASAR
ncbi:response regulator [Methylobacterium sp. CM6257]